MTMNIRQEITIKVTEVGSIMQCMDGSDILRREVVGIGGSEPVEGWYFKLWSVGE
jgi:hypothetical protein